jgi:hypothetical protein
MQLDLNKDEQEILTDIVTTYLADLRYEIADTDSFEFRGQLKVREALLNKILTKLQQ